ncbi:hypothetical protein [Macrococcus carouselicus]|uniref:Lipoprotein n=1 Tax=Macrococcus carouselicus TaxID=69969 RepID=A0A9Q8FRU9_9STAP|nr:hypothetical protein [Macrococcus carouselicus]TDM04626.1 hypothetical protein ERX40_05495 [Macrococcus carouselicus]
MTNFKKFLLTGAFASVLLLGACDNAAEENAEQTEDSAEEVEDNTENDSIEDSAESVEDAADEQE